MTQTVLYFAFCYKLILSPDKNWSFGRIIFVYKYQTSVHGQEDPHTMPRFPTSAGSSFPTVLTSANSDILKWESECSVWNLDRKPCECCNFRSEHFVSSIDFRPRSSAPAPAPPPRCIVATPLNLSSAPRCLSWCCRRPWM